MNASVFRFLRSEQADAKYEVEPCFTAIYLLIVRRRYHELAVASSPPLLGLAKRAEARIPDPPSRRPKGETRNKVLSLRPSPSCLVHLVSGRARCTAS